MPATDGHGGFDLCEHCGSEGYLYVGNGPDEHCTGVCPCCEGTGREWHDDEMGDDEDWTDAIEEAA